MYAAMHTVYRSDMGEISRGGIIIRQKLGRVGSRSRSWRPPRFFDKSGHVGMPYPEFSSIFPGHFRSEKNREKSREIGENRGQSRLFPTYLELFKRLGWPSRLIPTCPDKLGRLKNPDLDFRSRLGWPSWLILPISATKYLTHQHIAVPSISIVIILSPACSLSTLTIQAWIPMKRTHIGILS